MDKIKDKIWQTENNLSLIRTQVLGLVRQIGWTVSKPKQTYHLDSP